MRRISPLFLLLCVLLLSLGAGVPVATAGYSAEPHIYDQDLVDKGLVDSQGADATITFFELPLWIQIFYISGILAGFFGIFKGIPLVLGRIRTSSGNQNRNATFEYISRNPGCTIAEASEDLDMNRGTLKYHLRKLSSESRITIFRTGKFTHLFRNSGAFDQDEKVIISYLRDETSMMLLLSILENPGVTNQKLANSFSLDKSTIHWYLERFRNSGIVLYVAEGRLRKCFVNPAMEKTLLKFMPL